jgi:CMP-N-acetylneuraminic acid synthetase
MNVKKGECWGFVPARGGSKSIPLKNIHPFAGRPLMDYCVLAAKACSDVTRIICSTDSREIRENCEKLQIETIGRPDALGGDMTPVMDVFRDFLETVQDREGVIPEYIAFLQPTSPFILPQHITDCIAVLKKDSQAGSSQTVTDCPHQLHAMNQRVIEEGYVRFSEPELIRENYNKQKKQKHFLFGNVIVLRALPCLEQDFVFANPSLPILVDTIWGFDADGPLEFPLGEFLLIGGYVKLPFLDKNP